MPNRVDGSDGWLRVVVGAVFLAGCFLQTGCATEEDILFGDPERVAGGTSSSSVSSSSSGAGPVCMVDPSCEVSWSKDIYAKIFDAPLADPQPSGACSASGCHEKGAAGLLLPPGDANTAYEELVNYKVAGFGPYIVDCEPSLSRIMCNLAFVQDIDNPYVGEELSLSGPCGSPMPSLKNNTPGESLSQEQLDNVAEWIKCGAPNN